MKTESEVEALGLNPDTPLTSPEMKSMISSLSLCFLIYPKKIILIFRGLV